MVTTSSSTKSALHIDFLRGCLSKAQELKDIIEASQARVPQSPTYNGPIPDLNLPFPHDILLSVDEMGLPNYLCQQIKSKVTERILQYQRTCIEIYQRTCRELRGSMISSEYVSDLAKSYQNFYSEHQLPKFRANILISKATLDMVNKNHNRESKKPIFNFEYTPLLEKYFEHNAYPSRPDRVLLARKSSMSERQIEVWFQNHRNRAKKEGIPLKRMSSHQPSPLEFLEQKAPPCPILSKKTSSSQNDVGMSNNHNGTAKVAAASQPSSETFPNITPPPCAFPTPYRRNSRNSFVNSLPQEEGQSRFPPPNWQRKPATQTPSPLSINMEEFIAMFASKLTIRRGSNMKSINTTSKTRAWFSARVTIPSPAPHPALIRVKTLPGPSTSTSLLKTIVSSPSAVTNMLPSTSQSTAKNVFKPRKMAPFPFRTPQKSPLQIIDTSLPAHPPFGSRTSSFTSVSSSQSRSSSASIGSSPEPITPPHSPTTDSRNTHAPVVQDSTTDTYVDLFTGIIEPQFDFSQDFDYYLNNVDIFTNKHLPTSTHNFPYLDPLFPST